MIQITEKNIGSIIYSLAENLFNVSVVMYNNEIVWRKGRNVQSCFGAGYWQDKFPWTDNIGWKDNNK